jgi:monofunctional biosynthetic peptidoglycan transglycosylase
MRRLKVFGRYALAALAVLFATLSYTWITLPDVRPLRRENPVDTAFMRLRAREATAAGVPVRKAQRWVTYRRINPALVRAVLVAEDSAFWQHDGLDYDEIKASMEVNWAKGDLIRGASTITQQLAKNLYLSPTRNPYRKITELMITRRLEAELSKGRILEIYLNVIEWGDGIWGVEAASQRYFGVPAAALAPEQAALMAGAIINPRRYSPATPGARLRNRQKIILGRMGEFTPPPPAPTPIPSADVPIAPGLPPVLGGTGSGTTGSGSGTTGSGSGTGS